jgi:hypothetical protein
MDLRRLRIGEWLTAASGVVLLIALFLPWYEAGGLSASGWESFSITDLVLAVVALAGIAVAPVTARGQTASLGIAYESLVLLGAAVAVVVTVIRVLDPPVDGLSRGSGAYLGLVSVLALTASVLVAMRDERLSDDPGHPTDPTGVPAAPPEIETLPAPPRDAPA